MQRNTRHYEAVDEQIAQLWGPRALSGGPWQFLLLPMADSFPSDTSKSECER